MDKLGARFKQEGGGPIYGNMELSKQVSQEGGKPKKLNILHNYTTY